MCHQLDIVEIAMGGGSHPNNVGPRAPQSAGLFSFKATVLRRNEGCSVIKEGIEIDNVKYG